MKKFKTLLLILIFIPCFLLSGCVTQTEPYITNIHKSGINGNIETYTITYSDGTTSTFSIENGEDGEDLTLEVIQAYCTEQGISLEDYFNSLKIELNSVENAVNKALKSAVTIMAISPYQMGSQYQQRAGGAGVIFKMDELSNVSYIITNYHVVETKTTLSNIANEIKIFQYGADMSVSVDNPNDYIKHNGGYLYKKYNFSSSAVSATYVGGSNQFDIAILKVETDDLLSVYPHACPITVAKNYSIAETAIAIGNPKVSGMSVNKGIVSVESEKLELDGIVYRVMRIDTPVNPGNSGGGLFNDKGELIGIVNAKTQNVNIDNIAYAIPCDNAIKVAENIIHYYEETNSVVKVKKFYLGVTTQAKNSYAEYNSETNKTILHDETHITQLDVGGVGDTIGLKVGDVITAVVINGVTHNLTRSFQMSDLMLTVRTGDSVAFYGNRTIGEETTKNIKLAGTDNVLANQLKSVD